jgi:ABC-type glutathione transport system ATPase component
MALETAPSLQTALVKAVGLTKRYTQRAAFSGTKFVINALKDVDFEIQSNCVNALVGESGSGKSSLAACLALLEKPDSGEICFAGERVSGRTARELAVLRPQIQMVFQDSAGALNPRFSAARIIEEPLEIQRRASGGALRRQALELMEEVGLSPAWAGRSPLALSGGQRQRLAIARAIALQPALLILDESLSSLDLVTQAEILRLLVELRGRHNLTYLLISHDLSLVAEIADFVAVMYQGRIVEHGDRRQVFGGPQNPHTRELLALARSLEMNFHTSTLEAQA